MGRIACPSTWGGLISSWDVGRLFFPLRHMEWLFFPWSKLIVDSWSAFPYLHPSRNEYEITVILPPELNTPGSGLGGAQITEVDTFWVRWAILHRRLAGRGFLPYVSTDRAILPIIHFCYCNYDAENRKSSSYFRLYKICNSSHTATNSLVIQ